MSRLLSLTPGLLLMVSWGCALCANPHDCKFAAYGGLRERADMVHGRVGSVIDPASEVSHATAVEQSPMSGDETAEEMETPEPMAPTPAEMPLDDGTGRAGDLLPEDSSSEAQPAVEALPQLEAAPRTDLPDIPGSPNGPAGTIELPELESGESDESEGVDELPSEPTDSLEDLFGQGSHGDLADDLAAHFEHAER